MSTEHRSLDRPARNQPQPSRRLRWPWAVAAAGILLLGGAIFTVTQGNTPAARTATSLGSVDGIACDTSEFGTFHVHSHLAIFVNGVSQTVPYGIGIKPPLSVQQTPDGPFVSGGSCLFWLHTHAPDGVIHIESPVQRSFTLGEFFDIWGQPLSSTQVGSAHGPVTVYVNGQRYPGDPRSVPLSAHTVVQLDVAKDVPPQPYSFPPGE
ncbi:MAG: hypothetical protein M1118_10405 [Chloroflexi bacterium]|nr:hypothetical protein [Chloroflexota bacterium]